VEYTIDHVVETLKNLRGGNRRACLLVGAGCSVSAGIPTAGGFVNEIKKQYEYKYGLAPKKTYPYCMRELHRDEQRALIAGFVDKAKINWAHICMAILIQQEYVDRVLTTNFDPLVVRGCSLLNIHPAVYDCASSALFRPADIEGASVFHLHGQRSGFIMLNTEDQLVPHTKQLAPVFEDAGRRRTWIVVGYSGESDPVFDLLAEVDQFGGGLYWVGYGDDDPPVHVRGRLLQNENRGAYFVRGYDADKFFIELTLRLGCFPPDLVRKPFSHLRSCLDVVTEFPLAGKGSAHDVLAGARKWLDEAVERHEKAGDLISRATQLLMQGDYDAVIRMTEELPPPGIDQIRWALASAYLSRGDRSADEAMRAGAAEAEELFARAAADYEAALRVRPDWDLALLNWGLALAAQAKTKTGEVADRLFQQAGEKYAAALQINPDMHEALNNWGATLGDQARTKTGEEADRLIEQAGEKCAAALRIKPDMHEALNNWGAALGDQAETKTGEEADRLFEQAGEKYAAALQIKPDKHEALNNWGVELAAQARTKTGPEADRLFERAGEKYAAALQIEPDMHEALNNWGAALGDQARTKTGEEADRLFEQAGEKYAAALQIKPGMHEALNNWGAALAVQAMTKAGEEADRLFEQGEQRLKSAEDLRPGSGSYDRACLAALQSRESECRDWLIKARTHGFLPKAEKLRTDPDLASVRETQWFKDLLAEHEQGGRPS